MSNLLLIACLTSNSLHVACFLSNSAKNCTQINQISYARSQSCSNIKINKLVIERYGNPGRGLVELVDFAAVVSGHYGSSAA